MNKETRRFAILLVLIPVVTLAAWRQDSRSQGGKTAGEPAWPGLAGSMDKMHAAMASVKPSGDSDVDFVKLMLPRQRIGVTALQVEESTRPCRHSTPLLGHTDQSEAGSLECRDRPHRALPSARNETNRLKRAGSHIRAPRAETLVVGDFDRLTGRAPAVLKCSL